MAGSLPSAEELASIPRMGEVKPRLVTGASTEPVKLAKMRRDIAAAREGHVIRRNKRKVANECARLRKEPAAVAAAAAGEKPWAEWNAQLRAFIRSSQDWWPLLSEGVQDDAIAMFWSRLATGAMTSAAWRAEMANLKISVLCAPRSADNQRRIDMETQAWHARLEPSPPCGGW